MAHPVPSSLLLRMLFWLVVVFLALVVLSWGATQISTLWTGAPWELVLARIIAPLRGICFRVSLIAVLVVLACMRVFLGRRPGHDRAKWRLSVGAVICVLLWPVPAIFPPWETGSQGLSLRGGSQMGTYDTQVQRGHLSSPKRGRGRVVAGQHP